ncbi:uncharacterized protein Dwil_GK27277 [Drosophila willistoni]|uniref:uncharacterized protein LOC26529279 n=1 Tax=Drosophila willistoni TaxID=7260 RepID=UPI0007329297|nr:uncharacterized protein LOC26529279 [Drosophila willistoni]KRF97928.1 uncharacterized protein Dwil_GK27277 [Drosophila willistoni]
MRLVLPVFFLISVLFLNETLASKIKLTNVKCESFNQSWVTIDHCRLRAINRYKTVCNINATFHHPATKIKVRYQVLKRANGYKPWLLDATIDACAFMKKPNHPVGKIIYNMIKNCSTVTHTCPYVGLQYVKNFYVTPEQIPLPLPSGDYALFLTWLFSDKPQFATNVYFTFTEDLLKQ